MKRIIFAIIWSLVLALQGGVAFAAAEASAGAAGQTVIDKQTVRDLVDLA